MFTQYNTEGYTAEDLERLNTLLQEHLDGIDDPDEIDLETKRFHDAMSRE